jgi:hypothetical protein
MNLFVVSSQIESGSKDGSRFTALWQTIHKTDEPARVLLAALCGSAAWLAPEIFSDLRALAAGTSGR